MRKLLVVCCLVCASAGAARAADTLRLTDGTTIEADEVWDDQHGVWYRQGGVTYSVERARVKSIERGARGGARPAASATNSAAASSSSAKRGQVARLVETADLHHSPATSKAGASASSGASAATETNEGASPAAMSAGSSAGFEAAGVEILRGGGVKKIVPADEPVTVYLVGGASFEVDEAAETADGLWYKRAGLSIFIDRARIDRVERGRVEAAEEVAAAGKPPARRERRWSTGSSRLDQLIRQNGARHGVDPYLIFLVMEQESHFNPRAVSPVGARGLMQLMPGTAARFGVRDSHDPAQNISAGTRYLKLLMGKFNNRVELVLAGYNAGEGNVTKYGYRVPPFRETRNYVRKISSRYGRAAHATPATPAKTAKAAAAKDAP